MSASLLHQSPRVADTVTEPSVPAPARWRKAVRILGRILSTAGMVTAIAAFLFLAVGPRVLGYQTSTMLTGSMSPLINPGDVVVSVARPAAELKSGDVITYGIPVEDHRVETHRIIDVDRGADGTVTVRTKGDANPAADPWTATLQDDTVAVHTVTIPYLGTAIRTLRDPLVQGALTYGAPTLLVAVLLTSIWRKPTAARQPAS